MLFTTLIEAGALRERLERGPATVILDCRFDLAAPDAGYQAYRIAHVPGARYLHLNEDLSAPVSAQSGRHPLPSRAALVKRLTALGIDRQTQVVAYDDASGAFAARAWWLLRWLGFARVAVLDGGFKAWLSVGGAVESGGDEDDEEAVDTAGDTTSAAADPTASDSARLSAVDAPLRAGQADAVMTTDEVLAALQDPQRLLVDARAAERFAGAVEPLDAVAGHVPGAVNYPFSHNLTAEGRFLPPDELRRRWQERLGDRSPEHTILMCGSGVTACHNLLAMEHAGLPGAKLYAGSWSEWIRDPRRPVATGLGAGDGPDGPAT
jgi:thiosulfate/3-mercaptopyruvate sulfurtransferase